MVPDPTDIKIDGLRIDSAWKQEAEKEKEELARKVGDAAGVKPAGPTAAATPPTAPSPPPATSGPTSASRETEPSLPPASFELLVQQQITAILLALRRLRERNDKPAPPDLPVARLYIDLLGVLLEKTKNNLTEAERRFLETALYEMRMAYVAAAKSPPATPPAAAQ